MKEMINAFLQPFQCIWAIFDDDAHSIVSKKGYETLNKDNQIKKL